jgi:hypothetical protein
MLIRGINESAEGVGLVNTDYVDITEVLESHSQPLSNEKFYYLVQQLTEQHKR